MTSCSGPLLDALLGLAWSLWAELGVSAWDRRHAAWNVDPEALILFTATLADTDPRLRDESLDWCIQNHRYVSAVRLRNMLRAELAPAGASFGAYAATVRAHAPVNWPARQAPWPYRPTGKSRLADLDRPALIRLRLRALFGMSARAEIVGALATAPRQAHTAATLADATHYTKRNIEQEIHPLRLAGLLGGMTVRGRFEFRLARADAVLTFIGARPEHNPRWSGLFRMLLDCRQLLANTESLDPRVMAVEATKLVRSLASSPAYAGIHPPTHLAGPGAYDALSRWLFRTASSLANGDPSVLT